jgi:hypothetical protein
MFTGNYAKCLTHPNAVGISIGVPKNFTGSVAKELCPTWQMVKHGYTYREYVDLLIWRGVDPRDTYERYKGKIMLCYEGDPTKCHRRYLARWLKETLGIEVPEYLS